MFGLHSDLYCRPKSSSGNNNKRNCLKCRDQGHLWVLISFRPRRSVPTHFRPAFGAAFTQLIWHILSFRWNLIHIMLSDESMALSYIEKLKPYNLLLAAAAPPLDYILSLSFTFGNSLIKAAHDMCRHALSLPSPRQFLNTELIPAGHIQSSHDTGCGTPCCIAP
ncbi:hypothetical protein BS47DRAFT_66746 [Hydnum rufescens UP504]|uniref:Uncharacterized protein n=1 Tax=Hydnum rufescens UP504 TaxID=1448309 RepID=A0A9P6AR14_9AGAM|nr:hypothetical protein BS47DRAFT_66746 [Hydnum rufescens UP504]